ncbi:hypothetical protein ACKKBF_B09190 [Auxenochlorella protothecoides x Auxenochlorella symbiontica]
MPQDPSRLTLQQRLLQRETQGASTSDLRQMYEHFNPCDAARVLTQPQGLHPAGFTPCGRFLTAFQHAPLAPHAHEVAVLAVEGPGSSWVGAAPVAERSYPRAPRRLPPAPLLSYFPLLWRAQAVIPGQGYIRFTDAPLVIGKYLMVVCASFEHSRGSAAGSRDSCPSYRWLSLKLFALATGEPHGVWDIQNDYVDDFNLGVQASRDRVVVTLQRSRSVLILRVLPCGEFVKERHIGRNCYEDDALFLHMHSQQSGDEAGALANGDSPILPSLTHRMLAYAFHACCGRAVVGAGAVKAWGCGGPEGLPFHAVFPVIMRLQLKRAMPVEDGRLALCWQDPLVPASAPRGSWPAQRWVGVFDPGSSQFEALEPVLDREPLHGWFAMAPGRSMWPDPVTEWDRHSTPALASRRAQRGRSRPPAPAPAPAPGREAVGTGVCDTLPLACQRGSASPYMDSNLFMYDEGLLWDSHGSSCWRTPPSRVMKWMALSRQYRLNFVLDPSDFLPTPAEASAATLRVRGRTHQPVHYMMHPVLPLLLVVYCYGVADVDSKITVFHR